jgi:hypothetical protein
MLSQEAMPEPDGAPFKCCAHFAPYGSADRCPKDATHTLTYDAFRELESAKANFNKQHPNNIAPMYSGRMLCDNHMIGAEELVVQYA